MADKIQFVVDNQLRQHIANRTRDGHSSNATARRDLERYYFVMEYALASVELSEGEASLICDALNGVWMRDVMSPSEARANIVLELEDAMRLNGAAKKWGVDSDKLRASVMEWTDAQVVAVLDAVERFWARPGSTLQEIGLQ